MRAASSRVVTFRVPNLQWDSNIPATGIYERAVTTVDWPGSHSGEQSPCSSAAQSSPGHTENQPLPDCLAGRDSRHHFLCFPTSPCTTSAWIQQPLAELMSVSGASTDTSSAFRTQAHGFGAAVCAPPPFPGSGDAELSNSHSSGFLI